MALDYDFDIVYVPASGDDRTCLAMFRSSETAHVLKGAAREVRAYFQASGFCLSTHQCGAALGCVPFEDAQGVIRICQRVKANYPRFDPKDVNWNGFDFRAFVNHIRDIKVELVDEDTSSGAPVPVKRDSEPTPLERIRQRYRNVPDPPAPLVIPDPDPPAPSVHASQRSAMAVTAGLVASTIVAGLVAIRVETWRQVTQPESKSPVRASQMQVEVGTLGGSARHILVEP